MGWGGGYCSVCYPLEDAPAGSTHAISSYTLRSTWWITIEFVRPSSPAIVRYTHEHRWRLVTWRLKGESGWRARRQRLLRTARIVLLVAVLKLIERRDRSQPLWAVSLFRGRGGRLWSTATCEFRLARATTLPTKLHGNNNPYVCTHTNGHRAIGSVQRSETVPGRCDRFGGKFYLVRVKHGSRGPIQNFSKTIILILNIGIRVDTLELIF